jgi:hypothetical protein
LDAFVSSVCRDEKGVSRHWALLPPFTILLCGALVARLDRKTSVMILHPLGAVW